ncbi:MAG: sugar transferase [Thermoleophilaceae bacterium]
MRRFARPEPLRRARFDRRGHHLRRRLLAADLLALFGAYVLATVWSPPVSVHVGHVVPRPGLLVAALPVWMLLAYVHGLYHVGSRRADHGVADELWPVIQMTTVWSWGVLLVARIAGLGTVHLGQLAAFWALSIVLVTSFRAAIRSWSRRRRWYVQNVLAIGTRAEMADMVTKVARHPEWGLHMAACVDHQSRGVQPVDLLGDAPLLSGDVDVRAVIDALSIDRVVMAWSARDLHTHATEDRFELVHELSSGNIQVDLIPNWFEVLGSRLEVTEMEGMPLLTVPPMVLSRSSLFLKRAVDVTASALMLVVLAPLIATMAVAIKLDSPGPVLFRQRRIGKRGRPFMVLKFRSMHQDADRVKETVAALNHHGGGLEEGMFKVRRDPRVTRVGRFLRRTSLDELPQLWNILRGDMSFVGPRPLIENEDRQIAGRYRRRLSLTPGLTGLWQVHGRSEIPFEQMVNLDFLYVTTWSMWNDLKILIKTFPAVIGSRGAY